MDRVVNCNHEAVKVKSQNLPESGVDCDGIREAIQAREKLQKYHRQSSMPPVSWENAAIRLSGLSQRSSNAIFAKLRDMQKKPLYSQICIHEFHHTNAA